MRVMAEMSAILAENDSRVRETAWRMRSKKPALRSGAGAGVKFDEFDESDEPSGAGCVPAGASPSFLPRNKPIIIPALYACPVRLPCLQFIAAGAQAGMGRGAQLAGRMEHSNRFSGSFAANRFEGLPQIRYSG
jgi:hypothetical protein